ncbi:MAG: outer membrane protein assembly factor BamD [Candidatus Abyssobacteria bacterium SURF_17]|uniref:Outer membrane protein assembly factor BamD n=1 Tax=Candidatus Abyssobacteria bacterium SURF_17 TaxID=2093361 RepID=A0A419F216_9BACT|nr:MAG: outer membrane protein assembly factor BamD [Candidatus Abyssubacteria bacterium SURF_17]
MSSKTVIIGIVVLIVLAVAVGGLYLLVQKRMIRESANQFAAAQTLYEAQRWSEAEQAFENIVRKYPRSDVAPDSMYMSAVIAQADGRYQEALEKWERFAKVKENPRAVEVDYYRSQCLENLGKQAEAAAGYERVAAIPQAREFGSLAKAGLGRIAEAGGKLEEARTRYEEAIALAGTPETRDVAERLLGNLNLRIFLDPVEDEQKKAYLVQRGDSMVRIALNRNTTVDLLCRINDIPDPTAVRPGKRLLIPNPEFSILIDKSDFKLTLQSHGRFFKSYKVGLGKHGSTPLGEFVISDKIKNPTWWSPEGPIPPGDPRNELGTRWMALKPLTPGIGSDYGIHGTIDPSTVGWESSNGCPRMYPHEAEELYMLVTIGAPVKIVQ